MPPPAQENMHESTLSPFPPEEEAAFLAQGRYLSLKRVFDFGMALLALLPAIPILLVCAILIRLTSRGSAFYSQIRLGRFGRPFRIWKLRTMTYNCEKSLGVRWAMRNDPRVTPLGRFLRATHLD